MGRNFKNLIAWQKADDLAVAVYEATRAFPREETFGLRSQMRRAAVSAAANIAEGSGKRTPKDRRSSYAISMGELNELEYYIHLSRRLAYFDNDAESRIESLRAEAARTLDGLLKATDKDVANWKS
jgi:four helix bundle protein